MTKSNKMTKLILPTVAVEMAAITGTVAIITVLITMNKTTPAAATAATDKGIRAITPIALIEDHLSLSQFKALSALTRLKQDLTRVFEWVVSAVFLRAWVEGIGVAGCLFSLAIPGIKPHQNAN
jgi:hypothetical protein